VAAHQVCPPDEILERAISLGVIVDCGSALAGFGASASPVDTLQSEACVGIDRDRALNADQRDVVEKRFVLGLWHLLVLRRKWVRLEACAVVSGQEGIEISIGSL
jgi:hypothetical protein